MKTMICLIEIERTDGSKRFVGKRSTPQNIYHVVRKTSAMEFADKEHAMMSGMFVPSIVMMRLVEVEIDVNNPDVYKSALLLFADLKARGIGR